MIRRRMISECSCPSALPPHATLRAAVGASTDREARLVSSSPVDEPYLRCRSMSIY